MYAASSCSTIYSTDPLDNSSDTLFPTSVMCESDCGYLVIKTLVCGSHATSLAGGTEYNHGIPTVTGLCHVTAFNYRLSRNNT
jgi:hypothetical protein